MEKKIRMCNKDFFFNEPNKVKYLLYLLLVFCFEPKLFVKIPVLNWIYIIGVVGSFGCMLLIYGSSQKKPSPLLLGVIIYRLCFAVQTFLSAGDILMWGYMSIVLVTLCMVIDYYIEHCATELLSALVHILLVILTFNFIFGLIWPNGIIEDLYLIGIRTRFTDVIFPLMGLSFVLDWMNKRRLSIRTVYVTILSLITILQYEVITAVMGLAVMAFTMLLLLIFKAKWLHVGINAITLTGMGLLANYFIVFFQITVRMEAFFQTLFNKSGSLTGRVDLWNNAIELIRKKVIFGYGMADNGNFVPATEFLHWEPLWQAHNQWLQLLYDGGLLTLFAFAGLICMCHRGLRSHVNSRARVPVLAALFSVLIMMTVEIFSYTPYFFLLIFIGYHVAELSPSSTPMMMKWEETLLTKFKLQKNVERD